MEFSCLLTVGHNFVLWEINKKGAHNSGIKFLRQGVKKAYNRHLSTKKCRKKRESLGASDKSDGEVDDGNDVNSSNDGNDGSIGYASFDVNDESASCPSKMSRK